MVGVALAALPLAVFPRFGVTGISVAVIIAICVFTISLIAKGYQIRAIGRLVAGGIVGGFAGGLLVSPFAREIEQAQFQILAIVVGLVGGALWTVPLYCEYDTRLKQEP